MSNNYTVITGNGANVNFVALDIGGGNLLNQQLLSSSDSLPITNTNPLAVNYVYGLKTGANVIGIVNCSGMAAQNTVASGPPVLHGGIYNSSLPAINSTCVSAFQLDANGRLFVNNGVAAVGTQIFSFANTPTINTSAYVNGYILGGIMTFANVVPSAGYGLTLKSIRISSKSVQTCGIKFYFFNQNPTNSTWTDHAAPAINAADIPFLWGSYTMNPADSGLGTHTIWNFDGIEMNCNVATTNVYAIMVVNGTPTFTSTSDISASIGIHL